MRFAERIRSYSFWFLDLLRGNPIRNHLNDISFFLKHGNSDIVCVKHEAYLKKILGHAVANCYYYSKFCDNLKLSSFPVINKNIIKENFDQFIADNFRDQKLYTIITSGSTGTPFKTFHDTNKKLRNYADTLFFAGITGYELGQRLIYLKIWVEKRMRSRAEYWFQNIVPVDVVHFNDTEIEMLLRKIEHSNSTFSILGYASAIELICKFLDKKDYPSVKAKVKSVIAISESLNDYTRSGIEKYFRVQVLSRYSNLENGIMAQQELNSSDRFLVNTASYHIEILKMDSDEPVKDGELGRIIVTDLFNYALPMIRYDTGDIGAMWSDPIYSFRKYLTKIEGRKLDLLYDTSGNLVSSYLVYKNMWQYTEIDQYQLIQESEKRYTFRINSKEPFTHEKKLTDEFKAFLGIDADFRIEYVSEIPLLASGKRKKIVSRLISN